MRKINHDIAIACFVWVTPLLAQSLSTSTWEVTDLLFKQRVKTDQPFTLTFGADLVHESGETLQVPGFYNGNN